MKKHLLFGVACLLLLLPLISSAQNSTCVTAATLVMDANCSGTTGGLNSGDPTGNDDTDGNVCNSNYSSGDDFIFEYTATTADKLQLDLFGTFTYTGIMVTEGCPTSGTCFASSTSSSANETLLTPAMTIGVTYYVHISTWASPQSPGQFCLDAALVTPPPPPACGGNFYDSGGSSGDYGNGEEITTTICPDVSGEVVTVTFTAFNTEANYDELTVYDGDDASASNLGTFDGTSIPPPFTSTDLTGCLTFVFESDFGGTRDGWEADVTCAAPPSCPAPSTISATNITDVSADVTFSVPGSETSFQAALYTTGADPTMTPPLFTASGSVSPISFMGLTAETTYDAYVRTDCTAASSGVSDFAGPFTFTTNAEPPINDECGGAIVLTVNTDFSCGATTSGTVEGATASPEDGVICGGTEDDDVWFSFTATATTHRIELLNESGSDLYHSVWEGTCGGLTLLTGSCSDPEVSNPSGFTIGSTYFLRVYSWTGTSGQTTTFDVCIGTPPPPPSNDLCSGAIPATFINTEGTGCGTPTILPFSTDATTDSGVPTVCADPGKDQWFTWTATSLELTFDQQSLGGPGIAIFANCSDADAGQEIACLNTLTDGSLSGWAINDELLIQIYDFQGSDSDVSFCLEEFTPPTCGDASSGSASNITETSADLSWTSNGNCASDAYWVIPTGDAAPTAGVGGTAAAACGMTTVTGLTASTTYDFYVETTCTVGTGGPVLLNTFTTNATPPVNDLCANAIDLATLTSPFTGTTIGANNDDIQTCAFGNNSPDIYFTIDVPDGEVLTIGQTSNDYDSENYVGYGGVCGELNMIDCYDDLDTKTVTWQNCTGSTQTVVWVQDGFFGATVAGEFTLAWSVDPAPTPVCVSANSPADAATGVATSGNITWSSVTNACSYSVYLDQNDPPTTLLGNVTDLTIPYSGLAAGTTYYVLIVPTNTTGAATSCMASSFTTIAVAPNCTAITTPSDAATNVSVDGTITFASSAGADSYDVYLDQNATPTTLLGNTTTTSISYTGLSNLVTYYVQIVPKNIVGDATGCTITSFTTVDPPPANDNACNAISITVDATEITGTNALSTFETSESRGSCWGGFTIEDNSVWYSFIAPTGGVVEITTDFATDLTDSQLALYSITDCSDLSTATEIACSDDDGVTGSGFMAVINTLSNPLISGNTYYVQVDGYGTAADNFEIQVTNNFPVISDGDPGACESAMLTTSTGSGGKVLITDANGDVVAGYIDSEAMGDVNASVFIYDGTGTRDYFSANTGGDGFDLIDRSIVITPTTQPNNPVTVFLYFTQAEVDELLANADGDNTTPASLLDAGLNKFDTDDCADVVNPQNLDEGELISIVAVNAITGGYEVEISISTFSGFVVAESDASALPIKLNRFSAKEEGRHNMVEWSTSSEINVQDHTLMKSNDAKNWEVLGVVAGELQSNTNVDYDMIDVQPFALTYYQLMTTDIDGSTSYSPITSVTRNSERSSEFLGASPVPTRDVVNLNVYSHGDDNLTITLTDISGKKILVDNRSISSGDHQLPLDLTNMTNGIYMVTITSDFIQQTHRVIKN